MQYEVKLSLPSEWSQKTSAVIDENGNEAVHVEAVCGNCSIDIFIGELPEDTTPEDQAFSNYADMVGFDDDDLAGGSEEGVSEGERGSSDEGSREGSREGSDEGSREGSDEGESPIVQIKFNGKNAWGFEAMCEDNTVVAVLAQEIKSGVLSVINVSAADDPSVQRLLQLVESGLRVKKL